MSGSPTIREILLHRIFVPLEKPTIWIGGADAGWARTVVRLRTSDGIEGLGETSGDDATFAQLHSLRDLFLGQSPFSRNQLVQEMWQLPTQVGTSGLHALQAIETACWDIAGKTADLPLYDLLGGRYRSRIPVIGYLHPRLDPSSGGTRDHRPADLVTHARALAEAFGVRTLKMKGGVFPPEEELASLAALRDAFPHDLIRFDPNAFWSVPTAIRLGRRLEELSLEWLEDPTAGIEGMRRVRASVPIPFASNMCCNDADRLASAIACGATDVLLIDIDDWGGLTSALGAASTCRSFGIGVGVHSSGEAGISTALNLHLAAVLPTFPYAMDSYYHHQLADVITSPHRYEGGEMATPDGPGLGVALDEDSLARLEADFESGRPEVRDPTPRPRRPAMW